MTGHAPSAPRTTSMGRARGAVVIGAEGRLIEVEADIGQTLPSFVLLGLPDAALRKVRTESVRRRRTRV